MPIPVDQLNSSAASAPALEERILEFLRRDPSQAFRLMEIVAAVEGYRDEDSASISLLAMSELQHEALIDDYRNALGYLLLEDKVLARDYQGVGYYAAVPS